jgi:DNA-binding NarL/FixJ family response regulator
MNARIEESTQVGTPIRVVLVDDQRLLREGLRTLLELQSDLLIVGEASDGIEAELLIERLQPQVVLMDLRMPRREGVEAISQITARWPEVKILVLTTFDEDELVFRSIDAGAVGYLLKDVGSDALAEAIRSASRGESPLQPRVAGKLLRRMRVRRGTTTEAEIRALNSSVDPLTGRELEILALLGTGASNREIAERLSLTEGTVKNYISTILAKTGLRDRTQAALLAVRQGLAPR